MKRDVVWLKLFDAHKNCRFIRPLHAEVNEDTGRWYLRPRKKQRVMFTAHKETHITHGTLTSELLNKQFPGVSCRVPNVNHVCMGAGDTLTLEFGGVNGQMNLMSIR